MYISSLPGAPASRHLRKRLDYQAAVPDLFWLFARPSFLDAGGPAQEEAPTAPGRIVEEVHIYKYIYIYMNLLYIYIYEPPLCEEAHIYKYIYI
jgi:hypothetical protein